MRTNDEWQKWISISDSNCTDKTFGISDVLQVLYQFIRLQNSYNYIQFDGVVHSMTTIAKSEYIIQIMTNQHGHHLSMTILIVRDH
ncbi:hypothetical protein BLOT_007385 [Blomia tropicalis]|nr:hypothetical protein BLOT_007385 [Blomia tropicalis]